MTLARTATHAAASLSTLAFILIVVFSGCGSNGHITEDEFLPRTDAEAEAKERIQFWVAEAVELLDEPTIPSEQKEELRNAIGATRVALSAYNILRGRGANRAMIIAPIRASALGIIADDATGVGLADDALLIPLALAAIATYVVTDPPPSEAELTRAWNHTLQQVGALGATVDDILLLAAPGNVADTGIMGEVEALISEGRATSICEALQLLLSHVEGARDPENKRRKRRIVATQKFHGCRHSRKSRHS